MPIEPQRAKDHLREFLRTSLGQSLSDDDDIFLVGGATSLFAMELVVFIEGAFDILLQDQDLRRENFRTIDAMASLVGRLRSTD